MLGDRLAWLTQRLSAVASQTVTYSRGSTSAQMQATLATQLLKLADDVGSIRLEWTDLDLLIPVADLILAGAAIFPERGDLIQIAFAATGTTEEFEVLPYGGEPPYRWADPHRSIVRIHAQHVETMVTD